MNEDEILSNKAAIVSPSSFEYIMEKKKEIGGESNYHYRKFIKSFEAELNDEVSNSEYLEDEVKDLKIFIRQLSTMLHKTVKVFDYSYRFSQENKLLTNNFFNAKNELIYLLDAISEFASIIKYYERKGDYLQALKMKDFCYNSYCRSIELLRKRISIDVSQSTLKSHYKQLKKALKKSTSAEKISLLKELDSTTVPTSTNIELKKNEDYKKFTWFKVGLKFATGEAQQQYSQHQSYARLSIDLGFKDTDRPHFSESFSEVSKHPKNIFSDEMKISLICKHCKENNIQLSSEFLKRLPEEMK
jgi:hypothetical protein